MEIQIRDLPNELQWLKANTSRNYYQAIYSTLIELKPINCLEIGTFQYYSAKVFSKYFQEYNLDGKLITADISEWHRDSVPPARVYPVMVYPHREDINNFHGNIKVFHSNYKQVLKGKPHCSIINSIAINESMIENHIDLFDFAFVDGSHDKVSAMADLHIAKILTKPEGYILIDDITNSDHEIKDLYINLKEKNSFYEYNNWPILPDMALIQCKDLNLCL